jgi:tetratricopeptide (TPR) repeat protein
LFISLDLKIASTQTELGNYETALALYDGIAARAPNDYIKAQAAYESGLTYQALGQNDAALGKFRLAVESIRYPIIPIPLWRCLMRAEKSMTLIGVW